MHSDGHIALVCHRCGCDLAPGEGNFYIVRIEAFADPSPPNFQHEGLAAMNSFELAAAIDALIEDMIDMSERELMDQVHRRLTIHLCGRCYRAWIENPAG
jgi:hypothetical protein